MQSFLRNCLPWSSGAPGRIRTCACGLGIGMSPSLPWVRVTSAQFTGYIQSAPYPLFQRKSYI